LEFGLILGLSERTGENFLRLAGIKAWLESSRILKPNHALTHAIRLRLMWAVSRYCSLYLVYPSKSKCAIADFAVRLEVCFSFGLAGTSIIRSPDAGLRDAIAG
jgi:hypothetical protein